MDQLTVLLEGQLGCQGQLLARLQGGRWVWLQGAIAGQAVVGLAGQGYRRARWVGLWGASWAGLQGPSWARLHWGAWSPRDYGLARLPGC